MWILYALLAALFAAISTTLSKAGIKNANPFLAFAVQAILILLISWVVAGWQGSIPDMKKWDGKTWGFLAAAGVATTLSSLLTFKALSLGDAAQVNPLERLSLVFAVLFAALFLKEKVNAQIIIGVLLMAAGAVVVATAKR